MIYPAALIPSPTSSLTSGGEVTDVFSAVLLDEPELVSRTLPLAVHGAVSSGLCIMGVHQGGQSIGS